MLLPPAQPGRRCRVPSEPRYCVPSQPRPHPPPLTPLVDFFFFCWFEFYKILRVLPQTHAGGEEGGEGRTKDQTRCVAELYVCIYGDIYILGVNLPTRIVLLGFFPGFFFVSLPVSLSLGGSSARGRCGHLPLSKGIFLISPTEGISQFSMVFCCFSKLGFFFFT